MQVTLTVTAGPHKGRAFTFREHDTFIVGRATYAHFRLEAKDKYFSRAHFMIEVNPPLCHLIDMGSTNGTYVNGARVNEVDLKNGDSIKGGKTKIEVNVSGVGSDDETQDWQDAPQSVPAVTIAEPAVAAAKSPDAPSAGQAGTQRVGGYRLVRELGRGGMGIVYLAIRDSDQGQVALKTILARADVSAREVERFLREAAILQSLDHPAIVKFLEAGYAEGMPYLTMEYVESVNLSAGLARSGPLPVGKAVGMTCRLLDALDFAHGRGFVHRDIKPSNVLWFRNADREGIKLADFGLARVYRESKLSGLTFQGEIGGTIAFSAPEQITNFRQSRPASDLYSVGATLYKMLTDRYVYDFPSTLNGQVLMVLQEDPVPILARRPDVPNGLADIIHRALARDPDDRFPDAASMRKTLLPFGKRPTGPGA